MRTATRITGVVLIVVGIIVMLSGLTLGVFGMVRAGTRALGVTPVQPPLRAAAAGPLAGLGGLIAVAAMFVQGLMIIAAGEGLYLLTHMIERLPLPPA